MTELAQALLIPAREERAMIRTTLLELIDGLSDLAVSETDLVAKVVDLVNSGTVVLTGTFRGQRFRTDDPALAA